MHYLPGENTRTWIDFKLRVRIFVPDECRESSQMNANERNGCDECEECDECDECHECDVCVMDVMSVMGVMNVMDLMIVKNC